MSRIDFELDDCLEIALLQMRIQEINQLVNGVLKKYNIPDGWRVITNPQGRWTGAEEAPKPLSMVPPQEPESLKTDSKVDEVIAANAPRRKHRRVNGITNIEPLA